LPSLSVPPSFHFSQSFTRYIAGLMWRVDDDALRSRLTENLHEEAGETNHEERHAQILRRFLVDTLGLDIKAMHAKRLPSTTKFVDAYLERSARDALYSAAFLSVGTEGMVSPHYARLVDGMLHGAAKKHFPSPALHYFHLHIGCDDDHAATLAEVMFLYAAEWEANHPTNKLGWLSVAQQAVEDALSLRKVHLDDVYKHIVRERAKRHTAARSSSLHTQ
jgi:pyrroloquinoline quinone (PQQ) biosynthesis protein C